jgi:hypothetical protein
MHPTRTSRHRAGLLLERRAQRREGAVMMVVLLVLMVATASAAVAIRSTQTEIHSAGQNRLAVQSHYAADAAMNSMFAYIDRLGPQQLCDFWREAYGMVEPPKMAMYGEPEIGSTQRRNVARAWAGHLAGIQDPLLGEGPALSNAVANPGSGTGGGGGGGGSSGSDLLGSFGPRQAYGLPEAKDAFAVDFTDCIKAPGSMNAGSQLNGPATEERFFCTLTAHARLQTSSAASTRVWTFGAVAYTQDPLVRAHDSRATVLTPPINPTLCKL